jgi:hypothetical protein
MADILKDFPLTAWYKVILAIAAPCLFIVLATSRDTLAIFFGGWCLFGIGQWINHPKRISIQANAKITDVSRHAWWLGWIFEIFGVLTILYSFCRAFGYGPI